MNTAVIALNILRGKRKVILFPLFISRECVFSLKSRLRKAMDTSKVQTLDFYNATDQIISDADVKKDNAKN